MALKVNREDVSALGLDGQIDEENLVEAPLPQQLRRQLADVIRGRNHKDGFGLLLHPRVQRGEHTGRHARVRKTG